jgi:hypothetical protein
VLARQYSAVAVAAAVASTLPGAMMQYPASVLQRCALAYWEQLARDLKSVTAYALSCTQQPHLQHGTHCDALHDLSHVQGCRVMSAQAPATATTTCAMAGALLTQMIPRAHKSLDNGRLM